MVARTRSKRHRYRIPMARVALDLLQLAAGESDSLAQRSTVLKLSRPGGHARGWGSMLWLRQQNLAVPTRDDCIVLTGPRYRQASRRPRCVACSRRWICVVGRAGGAEGGGADWAGRFADWLACCGWPAQRSAVTAAVRMRFDELSLSSRAWRWIADTIRSHPPCDCCGSWARTAFESASMMVPVTLTRAGRSIVR